MAKVKYKARRDLPSFVREYKTFRPTKPIRCDVGELSVLLRWLSMATREQIDQ